MLKIDAHTHVAEFIAGFGYRGELRAVGNGEACWANGDKFQMLPNELGEKSVTPEALSKLLRDNDVSKAVLLQGSFYGFHNDYSYEAANKYPDMFLSAATFDPYCVAADQIFDRFHNKRKIRVFKFEVSSGGGLSGYHPDLKIGENLFSPWIGEMEKSGSTFVLDLGSPGMSSFQIEEVAEIADNHKSLKIVICHLLAPTLKDHEVLRKSLEVLKKDNIWFDLAAMPWNVYPEPYPFPTAQEYIRTAKEIVGSDKLIWGTDVPCPLTRNSYKELITFVTDGGIFTEKELEGVMAGNAMDAYPF